MFLALKVYVYVVSISQSSVVFYFEAFSSYGKTHVNRKFRV